ncbi:MAG: ankyrin repeat domain-containing protein [Candidatus Omnitrophota bacterium]|jgi:ankyrin repeat protein
MNKLKWFVSIIVFILILTPVLCLASIADQLCDAAMGNDIQKVNELIAKGTNVNEKSHYGLTALECAVWNAHTELVKLLIDKGADVNEKLDNNETALSIAKTKTPERHRDEIVKLLIQAGAKEDK